MAKLLLLAADIPQNGRVEGDPVGIFDDSHVFGEREDKRVWLANGNSAASWPGTFYVIEVPGMPVSEAERVAELHVRAAIPTTLGYTSGGTDTPAVGQTIVQGAASAVIHEVLAPTTGDWSTGDAAGALALKLDSLSGTFAAGAVDIQGGQVDILTADGPVTVGDSVYEAPDAADRFVQLGRHRWQLGVADKIPGAARQQLRRDGFLVIPYVVQNINDYMIDRCAADTFIPSVARIPCG